MSTQEGDSKIVRHSADDVQTVPLQSNTETLQVCTGSRHYSPVRVLSQAGMHDATPGVHSGEDQELQQHKRDPDQPTLPASAKIASPMQAITAPRDVTTSNAAVAAVKSGKTLLQNKAIAAIIAESAGRNAASSKTSSLDGKTSLLHTISTAPNSKRSSSISSDAGTQYATPPLLQLLGSQFRHDVEVPTGHEQLRITGRASTHPFNSKMIPLDKHYSLQKWFDSKDDATAEHYCAEESQRLA